MRGLMMDYPLNLLGLLAHAERYAGSREIVTRRPDRSLQRSSYAETAVNVRRLAVAMRSLGLEPGDRVATLAWNQQEHFEIYFGVPAAGLVVHTLNPRLHRDELAFIASDAQDRAVVVDSTLLGVLESFRADAPFEHVIVIGGGGGEGTIDYAALLASAEEGDYAPRTIDENDAVGLCYTSGTTGRPKGVLYSHRALYLHSLTAAGSLMGMGADDTVLPVVPMFHANAWGTPYTATLACAKQVFPGPHLDPASLLELLADEGATITLGVPTIWLGLLQALDAEPDRYDLSRLRELIVGGSAAPRAMIEGYQERHGLAVIHAWGMTEMCPLGTFSRLPAELADAPKADQYASRARQGTPPPLVEIRARGSNGLVPWDGVSFGELEVRGPWVAGSYYRGEGPDRFSDDGWFKTGDVVTIDERGSVAIADRAKDLVKSGGEWISSVALENELMGHPAVAEAAVIGVPHPRWQERPLAVVKLKPGAQATPAELIAFIEPSFARWWLPDDVEFVDEIPKTAAGKFRKTTLREQFGAPVDAG